MRSIPDEDHDEAEERWMTMGCVVDGRLLVVCHTYTETGSDKTIGADHLGSPSHP